MVQNRLSRFLSTLSLRRATRTATNKRPIFFISIHALLAESDFEECAGSRVVLHISIHALLAESDASRVVTTSVAKYFYPRSPCGERLSCNANVNFTTCISIHALLAESDVALVIFCNGERKFLSTLSLRRATAFRLADMSAA